MFLSQLPSHMIVEEGEYIVDAVIDNPLTRVVVTDKVNWLSGTGYAKLNPDEDVFDYDFAYSLAYLRAVERLSAKTVRRLVKLGAKGVQFDQSPR